MPGGQLFGVKTEGNKPVGALQVVKTGPPSSAGRLSLFVGRPLRPVGKPPTPVRIGAIRLGKSPRPGGRGARFDGGSAEKVLSPSGEVFCYVDRHSLMTLNYRGCFVGLLWVLLAGNRSAAQPAPAPAPVVTPLAWSQRLAFSEMARRGDSLAWQANGKAKWDYTAGLFTLALLQLNAVAPDARYVPFVEQAIGSFVNSNGVIQTYKPEEYQLDAINPGKTLLALWQTATNADSPRLFNACLNLLAQFDRQPRTFDGGFWHKQRYTNQMWLDGIYMGLPFYAAMGHYSKSPAAVYADVAKQIRLIDAHTYDARTGLNFHAWDAAKIQPWANPVTGCSSNFWGRAEGWYAMALVDVLDFLPTNHPARAEIIATLQKTARGIVRWQDAPSGLWWQVLDQGPRPGNYLEATASAMFVYALAKGVNHGYLPRELVPAITHGYAGIVQQFVQPDGAERWSLTHCCAVAGLGGAPANGKYRSGTFDYYISEPVVENDLKGVGPFILAGLELNRLR